MSAIAARKARLALADASSGSSKPAIDEGTSPPPTSAVATPSKRKAKVYEAAVKRRSANKRGGGGERDLLAAIHDAHPQRSDRSGNSSSSSDEDDPSASSSGSSSVVDDYGVSMARDETLDDSKATEDSEHSAFVPFTSGVMKNWHVHSSEDREKNTAYVGLITGQAFTFIGKAWMKVIDGQCSLAGALLTPSHRKVLVFAPRNHPLPVLQAQAANEQKTRCAALSYCGFTEDRFAAILKIEPVDGTSIDDIWRACPLIRPGTLSSHPSSSAITEIQGFYPTYDLTGQTCMQMPTSWRDGLSMLQDIDLPFVCLIKGPKRVGKSTFSRTLLNRLVSTRRSRVAYLETDLGQTEFGPSGLVALYLFRSLYSDAEHSEELIIGPSWTSLRHPLKSHFVGDVTPRNEPKTYMAAIVELFAYYTTSLRHRGASLIINTQGWIKGLGSDLLQELESLVNPTHIFEFASGEDDLPVILQSNDSPKQLIKLDAIATHLTRDRGLNAVENRMLNLVSYFYSTHLPCSVLNIPGQRHSPMIPRWDFSGSLLQQNPFIVDVDLGLAGGIHILSLGSSVDLNHQLMALNGSCVAIVDIGSDVESSTLANGTPSSVWQRSLTKTPPSFAVSNCLALAIVRSIDVDKGLIHLLSPLSLQQLQGRPSNAARHLCLIKGAIELPVWLSLSFPLIEASQLTHDTSAHHTHLEGVPLSSVPYIHFPESTSLSSESKEPIIGAERRKIRRNILRRSQR